MSSDSNNTYVHVVSNDSKGMQKHQSETSRQQAQLSSKSLKELQAGGNSTEPLHRLQLLCLSRGATGILKLGRMFRKMDEDGHKHLNKEEFTRVLKEVGLEPTADEIDDIFIKLDTDWTGIVDLNEFLVHIRPPLSEYRNKIIEKAFNKMVKADADHDEISFEDLRKVYNVRCHPLYISGEESAENIMKEFFGNFEEGATRDGKITKEEFFDYYAAVSASIDDDCYFDLVMREAYKL